MNPSWNSVETMYMLDDYLNVLVKKVYVIFLPLPESTELNINH